MAIDVKKLQDRHVEEMNDYNAYLKMSEECPEWAQIFRDMANEEWKHAIMINHMIEKITKVG